MRAYTNKRVVALLPSRKAKLAQARALKRAMARMQRELETLTDELDELGDVAEVFEGVALRIFPTSDRSATIDAVGSDVRRGAYVYRNASDASLWGLTLRTARPFAAGGWKETWKGASWKSKRQVIHAAKTWVAKGVEPRHNGDDSNESWR